MTPQLDAKMDLFLGFPNLGLKSFNFLHRYTQLNRLTLLELGPLKLFPGTETMSIYKNEIANS